MENLENRNYFEEKGGTEPELREEDKIGTFWYWIAALLLIILFGWYAYGAGWFDKYLGKTGSDTPVNQQQGAEEGENNGEIQNMDDVFGNETLAEIDSIQVETSDSFPVEKRLVVKGTLPDSCTYLNEPQIIRDGNTFYVNITTRREGDTCTEEIRPYELPVDLQVLGLPAGTYTLVVNGKDTQFGLQRDNFLVTEEEK